MIAEAVPYAVMFFASLALTLVLTPIVREICRALKMVDMPDKRRINVVPVPRGGGMAIVFGVVLPYIIFHTVTNRPLMQGMDDCRAYALIALSVAMALIGFTDDKFSLPPKVKLLSQVAVAFLSWFFAGLGFRTLWPALPVWVDCPLTILWIVGAVNAFNLIDGLDGLASGLAFIATLGMAGSLVFAGNSNAAFFHIAFAGGLLGFLRYNYNPASVFLGDSGSMFIGFVIGTLPLATQRADSFLVSIGVPLLAMGVPIFDTSLAILRRLIRRVLKSFGTSKGQSDDVMKADSDHLHHRILRSTGLNQRKTAWLLYAMAAVAVLVGLIAMSLQSRAAGLWLVAFAVGSVVVFRDAYIELFDAGQLLNTIAHSEDVHLRKHLAALSVPFYLFVDGLVLVVSYIIYSWAMRQNADFQSARVVLLLRVIPVFLFLVAFRSYGTLWSRALALDFLRLLLACVLGSVVGSVAVYYSSADAGHYLKTVTLEYALLSFVGLLAVRTMRGLVRDIFYAIDCSRLKNRKDVSRVLVYGGGLRYRAFRRELVRTTASNSRIIVGILDDDMLMRGRYIGGVKIYGTINEAKSVICATNADAVVIACEVSESWLNVVQQILEPTGVKVTRFTFSETAL